MKIKAILIDQSELHTKEYVSEKNYLYSYHWQDKNGNLKIRWDNAPHHKDIQTFPHHKHTLKIEEFTEASLEDIIASIRRYIECLTRGNSCCKLLTNIFL